MQETWKEVKSTLDCSRNRTRNVWRLDTKLFCVYSIYTRLKLNYIAAFYSYNLHADEEDRGKDSRNVRDTQACK